MKTVPDEWNNILSEVTSAVNFIKANAFNSRFFSELCKESDSEFETFLLHSQPRWWFSKRKVLNKIFKLPEGMQQYLKDISPNIHTKFSDVHSL